MVGLLGLEAERDLALVLMNSKFDFFYLILIMLHGHDISIPLHHMENNEL